MADVALSIVVSRTLLGLSPLEIAFGPVYYVAPGSFGSAVAWNRQQATSPWLDGAVTTQRSRQMVTEQLVVEVKGSTYATVRTAMTALIEALIQDNFTVTITVEGSETVWNCEAADYAEKWETARMVGHQGQVTCSLPRQPVPLAGVI